MLLYFLRKAKNGQRTQITKLPKHQDDDVVLPVSKKNLDSLLNQLKEERKNKTVPIIISGILFSLTFFIATVVFTYQLSVH